MFSSKRKCSNRTNEHLIDQSKEIVSIFDDLGNSDEMVSSTSSSVEEIQNKRYFMMKSRGEQKFRTLLNTKINTYTRFIFIISGICVYFCIQ